MIRQKALQGAEKKSTLNKRVVSKGITAKTAKSLQLIILRPQKMTS